MQWGLARHMWTPHPHQAALPTATQTTSLPAGCLLWDVPPTGQGVRPKTALRLEGHTESEGAGVSGSRGVLGLQAGLG